MPWHHPAPDHAEVKSERSFLFARPELREKFVVGHGYPGTGLSVCLGWPAARFTHEPSNIAGRSDHSEEEVGDAVAEDITRFEEKHQ